MILGLDINQFIVLLVLILVVVNLFNKQVRPAAVFLVGVAVLLILRVIEPSQFLAGLANKQIITIVLLILISGALRKNFDIKKLFDKIFYKAKTVRSFLIMMMSSMAAFSSCLNNTPIVAMMTPYVYDWGKRNGVSPSKLLIPLSYATILGGMITVIGTSTNLVMNGFLAQSNETLLHYTDFLYLGLIVTVVGITYIFFIGYRQLPEYKDRIEVFKQQPKEYIVETKLVEGSFLSGRTVTEAKLRNLEGIFLVDIIREGKVISPVSPDEVLQPNDELVFAGDTDKIVELVKENNGLRLPHSNGTADSLQITEVVVPANSSLAGKTVKDSDFRGKFDAAILAIHRNGERLKGKIGSIRLAAGDLLLLTVGRDFYKREDAVRDLYVISKMKNINPNNGFRLKVTQIVLAISVLLILTGVLELFIGLMIIFMTLVGLGLFTVGDVKKELDFDLIGILVCALALGDALIHTGTAELITHGLMNVLEPFGHLGMMIGLFALTVLMTSFVTNAAAVSILFPIAYTYCHDMGIGGTPFYVAITFAASAAFMTPVGYQTNLMVYGPGGYNFRDYFRIGFPLTIVYSLVCIVFITYRYQIG